MILHKYLFIQHSVTKSKIDKMCKVFVDGKGSWLFLYTKTEIWPNKNGNTTFRAFIYGGYKPVFSEKLTTHILAVFAKKLHFTGLKGLKKYRDKMIILNTKL